MHTSPWPSAGLGGASIICLERCHLQLMPCPELECLSIRRATPYYILNSSVLYSRKCKIFIFYSLKALAVEKKFKYVPQACIVHHLDSTVFKHKVIKITTVQKETQILVGELLLLGIKRGKNLDFLLVSRKYIFIRDIQRDN